MGHPMLGAAESTRLRIGEIETRLALSLVYTASRFNGSARRYIALGRGMDVVVVRERLHTE